MKCAVVSRTNSEGGRLLAELMEVPLLRQPTSEEWWAITWGSPGWAKRGLNINAGRGGKAYQGGVLLRAGVPTPHVYYHNPGPDVKALARRNNHHGGNDLHPPTPRPQFWTEWHDLVNEYRLHVLRGRVFLSGHKVPKEGEAHPWVRTNRLGWYFRYRDLWPGAAPQEAVVRAVAALGYDFGAVDVGLHTDGSPLVLEVNTAPGLTNQAAAVYAQEFLDLWRREGQGP